MMLPDTVVGERYRIMRLIGGGGMKRVYLAKDQRLQRECALAEMIDSHDDPVKQLAAITAFQREADLLAGLESEHIPQIFDRFSENNRHFLVMEYVAGETLEQKLLSGRLSEPLVIQIAAQILDTLVYLHSLEPPIIYRDLKPSNLILRADGILKMVDFGIARHFESAHTNTSIGTQGYAPPEQYAGQSEARSDLYALGALMHHLLTDRDPSKFPPFSFPSVHELRPDIDPGLAELIHAALAYEVDQRIGSARDFKRALEQIAVGTRYGQSRGMHNGPAVRVLQKNGRSIQSASFVIVPIAGVLALALFLFLHRRTNLTPANLIIRPEDYNASSIQPVQAEAQLPVEPSAVTTAPFRQLADKSLDHPSMPKPAAAKVGTLSISPASDDAAADAALMRFRGCWSTTNVFQVVDSITPIGTHSASGTIAPVALKFCWNRTADDKTEFEPPENNIARGEHHRAEGAASSQWLNWLVPSKEQNTLNVHVEELKVQTLANGDTVDEASDYDCHREGPSLECARTYVKLQGSLLASQIVSRFHMWRAGRLIARRSIRRTVALKHDGNKPKFWRWLVSLFHAS
jgi:serine/threonine protein kinase